MAIGVAYEAPRPRTCSWEWQWYLGEDYRGLRPNCPEASLGRTANYRWGTLAQCKLACEQNPPCNFVSRYGDSPWSPVPADQRDWHCYGYACAAGHQLTKADTFRRKEGNEWQRQTSWGHGKNECKTLRCTDTLVSAEEASHATGSCDARLSSLYEGYGFRRVCPCG